MRISDLQAEAFRQMEEICRSLAREEAVELPESTTAYVGQSWLR